MGIVEQRFLAISPGESLQSFKVIFSFRKRNILTLMFENSLCPFCASGRTGRSLGAGVHLQEGSSKHSACTEQFQGMPPRKSSSSRSSSSL